jgi:pyruvate dehydrogenase E2 component (dihydrolipoamide acetyltransferase)
MRAAIAALMSRSAREIPHYHVVTELDLSATLRFVEQTNADRPVTQRLLPVAALLKATGLAARRVPELNGFWVDDGFRAAEHVHLGVATSLRSGGLVAPALHDIDTKDLTTIMGELRDLVERARAGRLRGSEMVDPTMTVTNLGDQGVGAVYGLIYPPQVALVGFGRITERPWADNGMLGVRPVVTATLAADHRATDGMLGARFLNQIDRLLQEPEQL